MSVIRKENKLFKNYKKSGMEKDKDYFRSTKLALQKAASEKNKSYLQGKIKKNANNSK